MLGLVIGLPAPSGQPQGYPPFLKSGGYVSFLGLLE